MFQLGDFVAPSGLPLLGMLLFLSLAVVLTLKLLVALARFRIRRSFSLLCALAALPLIVYAGYGLTICSPYFWYVLLNQSHFEEMASADKRPGAPAFAIVETRDASPMMLLAPLVLHLVVYDESDELGRPPSERSPAWEARNGTRLSDGGGVRMVYGVLRHLRGHFYLVEQTYP